MNMFIILKIRFWRPHCLVSCTEAQVSGCVTISGPALTHQTPADTHQWGWCWARCVGPPRRCSSGSGCWGAAGPRGPACPGAPGCWRGTGSCQYCRSSDRCGSETDSPPGCLLWTEAEQNRSALHIQKSFTTNFFHNRKSLWRIHSSRIWLLTHRLHFTRDVFLNVFQLWSQLPQMSPLTSDGGISINSFWTSVSEVFSYL